MPKLQFCYEIHKDAGLARDNATGEDAKCYTSGEVELGRDLTDLEYTIVHETEMIDVLVASTKIKREHLRPISIAEFEEANRETLDKIAASEVESE